MSTVVVTADAGTPFLMRVGWYLLIGWWLTLLVIFVGYGLAATVVGLPIAFWLFNRIPVVLTLRGRTTELTIRQSNGETTLTRRTLSQHPIWLRALYFVLLGWWVGALWLAVAYVLSIAIITLPLGLLMFNRVGGVMTLLRY